jgi:TonB family protein
VKRSYFSEREFRWVRVVAVIGSLSLHLAFFIGLLFLPRGGSGMIGPTISEIVFGGSGGGGGEGSEHSAIQFGSQGYTESEFAREHPTGPGVNLIKIHVYTDAEQGIPVPKKEEPKKRRVSTKKAKPVIAENLPTRWIRRGVGPGSGGGTGGGSGGGIGGGQGYSIDWGGNGSRRLLSGRLPRYPEGTDKQMTVTLRFSVLPDGTVEAIMPTRKTDELLERAAITALRTWRFDPLPSQIAQEAQFGKVTFNFKLE